MVISTHRTHVRGESQLRASSALGFAARSFPVRAGRNHAPSSYRLICPNCEHVVERYRGHGAEAAL